MVTEVNLEEEIMKLKEELERTARIYQYNFQHPKVIALSQQLDKLIIRVMRNSWRN